MGDISDLIQDGFICSVCGEVFPDETSTGSPRACTFCLGAEGEALTDFDMAEEDRWQKVFKDNP